MGWFRTDHEAGSKFREARDQRRRCSLLQADARDSRRNAAPKLELLERATRLAYRGDDAGAVADASYRLRVAREVSKGDDAAAPVLSYWCFAPSLAVADLTKLGARSLLFASGRAARKPAASSELGRNFDRTFKAIRAKKTVWFPRRSGTLSPLDAFGAELGLQEPVTLENPHVVDASKDLLAAVVASGPAGRELRSTYEARKSDAHEGPSGTLGRARPPERTIRTLHRKTVSPKQRRYKIELGGVVTAAAERVRKGGVLVFFPSYFARRRRPILSPRRSRPNDPRGGDRTRPNDPRGGDRARPNDRPPRRPNATSPQALDDAVEAWKRSTVWSRLERGRTVVVEPRGSADFRTSAQTFDAAAANGSAVLLAVCRGKASEGMDFADEKCRVVIVTGLPYAPPRDPRVRAKRQFLDARKIASRKNGGAASKSLGGDAWYEQQAARAVNQAIGRCVRHAKDWGAILLADARFADAGLAAGRSSSKTPSRCARSGRGSRTSRRSCFGGVRDRSDPRDPPSEYPRRWPRRRRDSPPRNVRVAAAASRLRETGFRGGAE